jgi:hypothetical protein
VTEAGARVVDGLVQFSDGETGAFGQFADSVEGFIRQLEDRFSLLFSQLETNTSRRRLL